MSKRRPGPWVPLSVSYFDDEKLIAAGEFAEVMFVRMMAYAGRHPQWDGRIPRVVVLSRLGIVALESAPESAPENRLEALLESGLVTAHGQYVQLVGWLNWNESGEQRARTKEADEERKPSLARRNTLRTPTAVPEVAPESAPENVPDYGAGSSAQDKSREEETQPTVGRRAKRAHPLPEGWRPSDKTAAAIKREVPGIDLAAEHVKFCDWARNSKPMKDWEAAWRNWMRRAPQFQGRNAPTTRPTPSTPRSEETCRQPGHSGWANNCGQCRADARVGNRNNEPAPQPELRQRDLSSLGLIGHRV
jgi:hypothetical protein